MARIVPSDKREVVELLRDMATAIERGEMDYTGCELTQEMDHRILPGGELEKDAYKMVYTIRVAVESEKTYKRFKQFLDERYR